MSIDLSYFSDHYIEHWLPDGKFIKSGLKAYDLAGRLIRQSQPDWAEGSYYDVISVLEDFHRQYAYALNGNLTQKQFLHPDTGATTDQ